MRILIILLFIISSLSAFSQSAESFAAKWVFDDIHEKETLDSMAIEMMMMFFGETTLYLGEDGNFKGQIMGNDDEGTWEYKNGKIILSSSKKGLSDELPAKLIEGERLLLDFGKAGLLMKKGEVTNEDLEKSEETEMETVAATKEQVSKKWYMTDREDLVPDPNITEEIKEIAKLIWGGSSIEFKSNGKYQVQIGKLKEKGKWEFSDNNMAIQTTKGSNTKTWKIVSVSENELVLFNMSVNEFWTYSDKEQ